MKKVKKKLVNKNKDLRGERKKPRKSLKAGAAFLPRVVLLMSKHSSHLKIGLSVLQL